MNIFYLDESPKLAAEYQCDKHVVKMILETAQLLCTAHRVIDGTQKLNGVELYKKTHQNHPCAKWVRESIPNYNWAYEHFRWLLAEYKERYNRTHACDKFRGALALCPFDMDSEKNWSEPPQCMPDEYKADGAIEAYRNYYKGEKANICVWKYTEQPYWW